MLWMSNAKNGVMIRVCVHDETETNPLSDRAEIWLHGHGSWWIKHDSRFGATAKNLARHQVEARDTLYIYPDSREGAEIAVPFMMTAKMNPNGSTRDSIIVIITDHLVEAIGLPIQAATDGPILTQNRQCKPTRP